ncbi:alpha-galactosidase [Curvibacter sp. CHRR-16]|uniref:alpha-galactosidase n=1 Tax=Curvibacter sp. CHRR-16 TaxID=2835872 RepID=UPI001BDAB473|nr:alpha-galactosidase [Curvibacter sp. CHRR-16]MBT0570304.1 alpha-galactosidase [Curvibacter sp. CHRR-16]
MSTHAPDTPASYLVLHSQHTSVVLECRAHEAPLWRYWGPRLPDGCTPLAPLRDGRAIPPSSMEFDQPLSVTPTLGVGWYHQSALLAHRTGQQFAQQWTRCVLKHPSPNSLTIHLHDEVAQLQLDIGLHLSADDVLSLHSTLHNRGDNALGALDVQWLAAATLPLPGTAQQVHYSSGQWANEFWPHSDLLGPAQQPGGHGTALWVRENRRGRTSHDSFPAAVVTLPGATSDSGVVYGAHLAWSGNHRQCIEWLPDGQYQWQLGEWLAPGEVLLVAGESITTPTVYACCAVDGHNGLMQRMHRQVRQLQSWPGQRMRPRPVHLNTWEALYFDHTPEGVEALARAAAAVGVERFVLDDGWFHRRHSDRAALGDWWPDEGKYPHGLQPLAALVQSLGMELGLWVEPEMVSPDSALFRQHPDWALQLAGRPLLTMRNQLVLDMARPEVADYLFERLSELLRTLPIAYLKWDMNRDLTTAGNALGRAAYRGYVLAWYALVDRLRNAFPLVEIESCASGGARLDYAAVGRTHRVWTSDCNDAASRVRIQRGALQWLPPEILGCHIGPAPAHTTGRSQSLHYRAGVALSGHLGLELDVRHLPTAELEQLRAWVQRYKDWRHLLHGGTVWLGEAGDGVVWQAHGSADELLVLVYRTEQTTHRYTPALRLPMLDANAQYRIERLDPTPPEWTSSPLNDAALATETTALPQAHGGWLQAVGWPLPRMLAESALLYHLARI